MAKSKRQLKPYALKSGIGWTYRYGIDITVKTGELQGNTNAAFMEYTTKPGESADSHTHRTEDEMFYVISGSVTFRCGEDTFDVRKGGFVFLPHGIEHSYKVRGKKPAHLIVITSPIREGKSEGWGGFVAEMESGEADLIAQPPIAD